jgi:hypothetical protein
MKGDFSRGHAPDRRRGERYAGVWQQQGRVLLDSDLNALTDALRASDREALSITGCRSGSPDLGWLVTPGRLLGVFPDAAAARPLAGAPQIWCDHARIYGGRMPALRLAAPSGAATIRIALRQPFDPAVSPRLVLWIWAELNATVTVNGQAVAATPESPNRWKRYVVTPGGGAFAQLDIGLAAGNAIWLGLVEQDEAAGAETRFWAAGGRHVADGLVAALPADAAFPDAAFPDARGFRTGSPPVLVPLGGLVPAGLAAGQLLLAYLETWERMLGPVEAPGLVEQALGGGVDTTLRSQVVGQLKLGRYGLAADAPEAAIRAALAAPVPAAGTLSLGESLAAADPDPCALPELEGYAGQENRLYRFEVHRGGALGQVLVKWSRDNAGLLVAATLDESANIVLPAGSPLRHGDLVEVTSETVELGDAAAGRLDGAGFLPPQRAVGQLGLLAEIPGVATGNDRIFRLVSPADEAVPAPLDARYGDPARAGLRLRRWDGLLEPATIAAASGQPLSPGPHPVELGLTVTLSPPGSPAAVYRPVQHWQFELRVSRQNLGAPGIAAQGPERFFAPLALFRFQAAGQPLELLRWLDERFPPLCGLGADDIAYDGAKAGSPATNVQQALDSLFVQVTERGHCGEIIVGPGDDLQAVLNAIPAGADARICLHPGVRPLNLPVSVAGKGHLVISGAGPATQLVSDSLDGLLGFTNCAGVTLRDFAIRGKAAAGGGGVGLRDTLRIVDCAEVTLENLRVTAGGAPAELMTAVYVAAFAPAARRLFVRITGCTVRAGNAQGGILVLNPENAVLRDNLVEVPDSAVQIGQLAADAEVAAAIGSVFLDRVFVGEPPNFPDDAFLGSAYTTFGEDPHGRPRIATELAGTVVLWSSHPSISVEAWERLIDANPLIGATTLQQAWWAHRAFRELRARLGRRAAGLPAGGLSMPANARAPFDALGAAIVASSALASGTRGITVAGQTGTFTGDVRIEDNRVIGFRQGIHTAAGSAAPDAQQAMRVRIEGNSVAMRVPLYTRERHGIFSGDAQMTRIVGNRVEMVVPNLPNANALSVPIDGIRVWGAHGPLLLVAENAVTGPPTGIRIVSVTAGKPAGAVWAVRQNGYAGFGAALAKPSNVDG